MNLFDLTGKVAIITGSSRGIGKAIAERMAEHGAKVVISSRKLEPCEAVATDLNTRHGPGTAIAVPANIASKEDLQHLVDQTRKVFGQVDICVCNAASNPYYGPLAGISDDQFRKILDNNIISNHWLISMVAPELLAEVAPDLGLFAPGSPLAAAPLTERIARYAAAGRAIVAGETTVEEAAKEIA